MEAEYNSLSMAKKVVRHIRQLLKVGLQERSLASFKTKAWKDNFGALNLANMEPGRMTQ